MAAFFVPGFSNVSEAEGEHRLMAEFLTAQGFRTARGRIFKIRFRHKDEEITEQVGAISTRDSQTVMAIYSLEGGSFAICTETRGWDMEHLPFFTGSKGDDTVLDVEMFES